MSIRRASAKTATNTSALTAASATPNAALIAPSTATTVQGGGLLGGPAITSITVMSDATFTTALDETVVSSAGGYVKIIGTGFQAGANVYFNNSLISNTFVNSTQINANIPATSAGTYSFYIFNSNKSGVIYTTGVPVSGIPTWTTGSYTYSGGSLAISVQLLATGDGTLNYYISPNSSLPAGVSLSSTGLLTGTVAAAGIYTFTVIVDDAQLQSTQQDITLTVITADSYFNSTTLLLNAETPSGTDTWISDASTNKFPLTVNGATQPSGFSPYNISWSTYFNSGSSGNCLTAASNADFGFTGAFTIEAWVNKSADYASGYDILASVGDGNAVNGWFIELSVTRTPRFYSPQGSVSAPNTNSVDDGKWHHWAFVRDSNNLLTMYLDGTSIGSATVTGTINYTGSALAIGAIGTQNGGWFNGYISNFRIVKGTAVYTTNFTPSTTPLTAISGTVLLTCQSNRFVDTNTQASAKTITVVGTPQVKSLSPFVESNTTKGSGYYGGSGDYLTCAQSSTLNFGTGDYTIEAYVYVASSGVQRAIVDTRGANATGVLFYITTNNKLNLFDSSTTYLTSTNAIPLYQWVHVAVSRSSATTKLFINGAVEATLASDARNNVVGAAGIYIGRQFGSTTNDFLGYMADVKISNSALYTGAYTPPTSMVTSAASTLILTQQYRQGEYNSRVLDTSAAYSPMTKTGNPSQGSFTPFSIGGWSNFFSGNGNFVYSNSSTAPNPNLNTQWTCECWVFPIASGNFLAAGGGGAYGNIFALAWTSSGTSGYFSTGGNAGSSAGFSVTSATSFPPLQWYHVALTKNSSNVWTLYVNGTSVGTSTYNFGTNTSSYALLLNGLSDNNGLGNSGGSSYISNVRITQNGLLYNGSFTPSTSPLTTTVASGTVSVLTAQSYRFADAAGSLTFTASGSPSVQAYSPFVPSGSYSVSTVGGSTHWDGSSYLNIATTPMFTFGTGDFTMEFWLYPTSTTQRNLTFPTTTAPIFYMNSSKQLTFDLYGSTAIATTTATLPLYSWTHCAVTRSGTSLKLYLNGVESASATNSTNWVQSSLNIGTDSGSNQCNGYMTGIRIVKGQALATGSFTPPTAPVTATAVGWTGANAATSLTGLVALLVNSTNPGILDYTQRNNLQTIGLTRVSTTQTKFGTASIYCPDASSHVITSVANYPVLTGDFTIEFWVRVSSPSWSLTYGVFFGIGVYGSGGNAAFAYNGSNIGVLDQAASGYSVSVARGTDGVFHHAALVRQAGVTKFYYDGSYVGTTNLTTGSIPSSVVYINRTSASTTVGISNGIYFDDIRITNYARYVANFTAPTSAFFTR